jgi:prophage antirepressor-like protein
MLDSNSVNCYNESLRQRVFALLNEYPWLTAKNICRILKLQYKQHCAYVNNLKYSWKSNHKNERVQSVQVFIVGEVIFVYLTSLEGI